MTKFSRKLKSLLFLPEGTTMGTLTNKELAMQTVVGMIIVEIGIILLSVLGYVLWPETKMNIFYGANAGIASVFSYLFLYRFLERKFNMYTRAEKKEYSSEGTIIKFIFFYFCFVPFCTILAWAYGNPIQGFGWGFAIFYPSLVLFFKRDVFSEKTKISDEPEIIGYNPKEYVLLGILSGFILIILGFYTLNAICLHNSVYPLWLSLLTIGLGLVYVILVLSPEIWNKYLPFEVQENKGYLIYLILTSAIGFLLGFIMAYAYPKI